MTDNFALPKEETEELPYIEENFPQVDPNAVEKDLIEKFKDMQQNMPMEDVAAHFFQMYYPIYVNLLAGLSNKDARRVAEHVVQWPLEDAYPKFTSDQAKQAFQLGIRLVDCKMIMKGVFEMERLKEAEAAKVAAEAEKQEAITGVAAETNNTTETSVEQGEQTNG